MTSNKKKELIEYIAHALDISPDMYNRSQSVVKGLANYLVNIEPCAEIYKQGSFRLGTIIKPYQKDKHGDFDIDIVVQFSDEKSTTESSEIKARLGEYLKRQNYSKYLGEEGRRCWTLNYPDTRDGNTLSFHIDLLPCVKESNSVKTTIKPEDLKETAIAITHISDKRTTPYTYEWRPSNPLGFAKWFDCVNYGKYKAVKANDRLRVFENNKHIFSSLVDVSDDFTRSPLQMVIQILKRHRDVMYASKECADYKPISIILTTLVGKIIEENEIVENNTYELLNIVLKGLEFYASLQKAGITSDFSDEYKTKQLISKRIVDGKSKWFIKNPANSAENLADKWNIDFNYAMEFFRWVQQAQVDLIDILDEESSVGDIIAKLEYCLGADVADALESFTFLETVKTRPVELSYINPKPYQI